MREIDAEKRSVVSLINVSPDVIDKVRSFVNNLKKVGSKRCVSELFTIRKYTPTPKRL